MEIAPLNALTARWAATHENGSTVMSGFGVWPLLAFLAAGAAPKERAELEEALGMPADAAVENARTVMDALNGFPAIRTALGLWTRAGLPVRPAWSGLFPDGVHGRLTGDPEADRRMLDAWAHRQTDGLIPSMPIDLRKPPPPLLVLASALLVRTKWLEPFEETVGGFEGRHVHALARRTDDLDHVHVAETPIGRLTTLTVVGDGGVDVHLALGEGSRTPGEVLTAAIETVERRHPSTSAEVLPVGAAGPGLAVGSVAARTPRPYVQVTMPRFTVRAKHDLLDDPGLFGLATAVEPHGDHFPGVSEESLVIDRGGQEAMASFQSEGFESAAVTAFGAVAVSVPVHPHEVKRVDLTLDRPFAALAVHRPTGLVLTATWVADADPYGRD